MIDFFLKFKTITDKNKDKEFRGFRFLINAFYHNFVNSLKRSDKIF